ncbi:glycosyltransferase family 4 protein [Brevibacillus humidisoli]|uniref:glycosyltransferase family 4 protein n=1 Tax=Brevibacillus humidisoli TaxID=2895522 RepID=UPI001E5EA7DA|nr:glycosyltransferase family 4 protein [Brevibacillus humidisoli]UFJ39181.1 glycosyltransferase family 4 protein [Brevibacillus humidisoli]
MRILFSTYWGIPQAGKLNTSIHLLKKELERHGHQVDLLAHHPDMQQIYLVSRQPKGAFTKVMSGQSVDKAKIKQVIYSELYRYYQKYLPHVHPWIRWREIERYTFELAVSLFHLDGYDMIHTHDVISTRALWRVKPRHIPLIFQNHGLLANDRTIADHIGNKESLKWKYVVAEEYYGAISCNQTLVPAKWLLDQLNHHYGVPNEQCKIIPYGLDLDQFLEWLQYEPYPVVQKKPDQYVISCPASLAPRNGHKILIEALCVLAQKRNDFICWLIGDGEMRHELEEHCAKQGIADRVVFLGHRADVPSLYNKTDVIVLPSLEDLQPSAIMEAQIAGKVIIASDSGGIPEMIKHGDTGLLFPVSDSEQLAERLSEVMNDSDLRQHLERNAKEWGVHQWPSKVWGERVINVYDQVLKALQSPAPNTLQQPHLGIPHGFTKKRSLRRDSAASMFIFRVQSQLHEKEWDDMSRNLPAHYSIPDLSFLKVLTETNHFDS